MSSRIIGFSFIARYKGSIGILVLTTLLTLGALAYVGYDVSQISRAYIGNSGDTYGNSWFLYQTMDNLLHRPVDLSYSSEFYGERGTLGFTGAPYYGLGIFMMPVFLLSGQSLELAYNLLCIVGFPLTAWATLVFVRYLFSSPRSIAFIIGLMTVFAQIRFHRADRLESVFVYRDHEYPVPAQNRVRVSAS